RPLPHRRARVAARGRARPGSAASGTLHARPACSPRPGQSPIDDGGRSRAADLPGADNYRRAHSTGTVHSVRRPNPGRAGRLIGGVPMLGNPGIGVLLLAGGMAAPALAAPQTVTFAGSVRDARSRPTGGATVFVIFYAPARTWRDTNRRPAVHRTRAAAN